MSNVITADQFSNIYALYVHGRTPLSIEYEEESDDTENVYHDPFCDIFWDELIAGFMEVFEKALNPLERDIVIRKAVCEHTSVAIGKKHGVSDKTIHVCYHKALRKIRRYVMQCVFTGRRCNPCVHAIDQFIVDEGSTPYFGIDVCRILSGNKDSCWYKQYILSDEMIKLLRQKPVKQKPKAKKRKKPVVSEPPVAVSEPPVVDDKVDQKEQEPIDDNSYLKAYVVDNTHGNSNPILVRFERVNGSLAYMVFKEIHREEYRMLIESVNVQLESCNVRIAVYSPFPYGYRCFKQEVDIDLYDFLNDLGIYCDICAKPKPEIATAILRCLQSE